MDHIIHDWVQAMRAGDHDRAWAICEAHAVTRQGQQPDDPSLPFHQRWVWDLRPLAGREVLVRCYHGLGDTIQFLRFLPELRRRAASVTLEIQPRLTGLLDEHVADLIIGFRPECPLPPAKCDVEIMELSFALRAHPAAFPPPYLQMPPAVLPPGTIALCCRAGEWDQSRSIPPELLAPLCEGRNCIALDPGPSPLPVLNARGCPFDMVQTAALIAGASLVITVDTMVAHLAGAMNKPTWLLLKHAPDWRWAPDSGRSEWYPSMRLYAQARAGDWAGVAARVRRDLDEIFDKQRMRDGPDGRLPARPRFMGRADRQDHHSADQAGAH